MRKRDAKAAEPVPPDPLIDEVRQIRRELSDRFGNDVFRLGRYLQEQERQSPRKRRRPPADPLARSGG